jgi:hypothetical protein
MQCDIDLGLDNEIYVNCEDFLQLLRSLPDSEFEPQLTEGALRWTCGPAKGHLSLMTSEREQIIVPAPDFVGPQPEGTVDAKFGEGLELGSLSCGSMSLRTLGLQGVQIKNSNGKAYAYATDNTTFSACCLGEALDEPIGRPGANEPKMITLLPEATELLSALLKRDGISLLTFDNSSVYCVTLKAKLLLHQVPPLRTDISLILNDFARSDVSMPLYREAVSSFIKRAEALSDSAARAMVEISVEDGRTRLLFSEATAGSEEYYIVQGGPKVTVQPVRLEAHRLAKALAHANDLIFDYANHNVLILRGDNEFVFAVTGRRE